MVNLIVGYLGRAFPFANIRDLKIYVVNLNDDGL